MLATCAPILSTRHAYSVERRFSVCQLQEQDAIGYDEQDATPLRQRDHLVPVRPRVGQLCASPVASLERELVLLRQLRKLGRPCALAMVWICLPGVGEEWYVDGWGLGRGGEGVEACPARKSGQHVWVWRAGVWERPPRWPRREGGDG